VYLQQRMVIHFAIYTVTNPNNLAVQLYARIDGFEGAYETLNANETKDIAVGLIAPQQTIEDLMSSMILTLDLERLAFTNNWFSPYSVLQNFVYWCQLNNPNFGTSIRYGYYGIVLMG
jgi:hypothetical protein